MSKINQIQQSLLSLSGGEFQKLADTYLSELGYQRINSIGSVTGANKVRIGTPDTLVALPNGKFVFAEYTTQQGGQFGKIKDDLSKCLDEGKTGVPVDKIERVIFCFTSKLNGDQEQELAEICQEQGVNLDLFGIDAIAYDLYRNYPGLARDFLGVSIDTGQIVSPNRFVTLYSNNKLATPLDTDFHFRDEKVKQILDSLESEQLVVLSGRPGVGKSRLALEVCRRFEEVHNSYEVMCVFGRNRDLWEDLRTRFQKPGNFLIFVDDANRVSKFEYVIDLLLHQREDQKIKVVATVRDYALSKVLTAAEALGGNSKIGLGRFTDEEIKELIKDQYEISSLFYLDRIASIAQGNPRLAVMAAEVAKENSLNSINDASALYERYFSSIRADLEGEGIDLESTLLLQVAAIVVFFNAVDYTDDNLMKSIEQAFDISPVVFWKAANQLHMLELLDIYENEVVKISDQVLATYLFYLGVYKEKALDFGALLDYFFPRFQYRMIESINSALSAFDNEFIADAMRPHIKRNWERLENAGDVQGVLQLFDVFWFVDRTDTLVWTRNQIEKLDAELVNVVDVNFKKSANAVPSPSILSILRLFAHAEKEEALIALDLLSRYLHKKPLQTPVLLRVLTEDYNFYPTAYMREYEIQHAVVDIFKELATKDEPLFSRIFLAIGSNYLGTHFENHGMKGRRELQIVSFYLLPTPELAELREKIWKAVFALFEFEEMQLDILRLILHYSTSQFRKADGRIIEGDAEYLLPFVESTLDPTNYWHCIVSNNYLDLLEKHNIAVTQDMRQNFQSDAYMLSKILIPEQNNRRVLKMSVEDYRQFQQEQLESYVSNRTFDDYSHFIQQCLEIKHYLELPQQKYKLQLRTIDVLLTLARKDFVLYEQVIKHYLSLGDPLKLSANSLIWQLIAQRDAGAVLKFISRPNYPTKLRWLFYFHEVLPKDAVNEEYLNHLYKICDTAEVVDMPQNWDFLLKYLPIDPQVVVQVVEKVLVKIGNDTGSAYALTLLFTPSTQIIERLAELFFGRLDVLKQAYLAVERTPHNNDYTGQVYNCILDLDLNFIIEFIEWLYQNINEGKIDSDSANRDYSFIWTRFDYRKIGEIVLNRIFSKRQNNFALARIYLEIFFKPGEQNNKNKEKIEERQNDFIFRLIDGWNEELYVMEYVFETIAKFAAERRRVFIKYFLQQNTDIDVFIRLQLEPHSWMSFGSRVPTLQGRVDYWNSLLPLMNSVELLQHRQYVKQKVQSLYLEIEQETRSDFIKD